MAASSSTVTLDVPRLSPSAFADREASDDTAISESAFRDLRRFRPELAFEATPSNNVQIAFGCDDCSGCENGNCDGFEGPQPGSLAFRIPLGTPRQGQVSGFLWFRTDEPLSIAPAVFNLSMRSDATLLAESNNVGQAISRVNCADERGRDLRIATMADGVRITVSNALCTILEHTWEIANVEGSAVPSDLSDVSDLSDLSDLSDVTAIATLSDYTPHAGD